MKFKKTYSYLKKIILKLSADQLKNLAQLDLSLIPDSLKSKAGEGG